MDGVAWKPRAYEEAATEIEALERPVVDIDASAGVKGLDALPSVGAGIAEKIDELLRTGRIGELEALRRKRPVDVLALTRVEGMGARKVAALHDALGVRTLDDLAAACRAGRVRGVPRFGAKSEEVILRAVERLGTVGGRRPLGDVLALAREVERRLRALPSVEEAAAAGSVRRGRETIGDLDFVVASREPERVFDAFLAFPEVVRRSERGGTKASAHLALGLDADLRVVPAESYGAALLYFTGSKAHNVALRRRAQLRGWKLNEYGLFRGEASLAGRSEAEVYAALGLPWIPPELREDAGELEAAEDGRLPTLLEHGALRGDLQVQTEWSDGAASIEDMAAAAKALGLEYLAVTDHTRDLGVARGMDEARLREQAAAIAALNRRLRGFRVLSGAEVNIRPDGSLDVDDAVLAELDVVGAAVHSSFHQSRDEMTRRVVRALENPNVDVLFHPTARLLGQREPVALDLDAVIAAAVRTGTVLEIDALPQRLDLRDEHARAAIAAGAKLAIDSDAHAPGDLAFADALGVTVARRAWVRREDVVNAWPVEKLLGSLKGRRRASGGPRPARR